MTTNQLHSVSVAGVVFDHAGQVLLIRRRDNGQWQPPGGVLELDETFERGVAREVLEETGITVEVECLTGAYKNLPLGIVALVYRCHPTGGAPTTSTETDEVAWLPLNEALSRMQPVFAIRFEDAVRAGAVASRSHDGARLL